MGYKEMIDRSCTRTTRMISQSMMTEWYWSGTLYAFARVCNLRCSEDAQKESKEVADKIALHCETLFPCCGRLMELIHLLWIVFSHRLHHFLKGEGFRD